MTPAAQKKLSKFMSLVLRHRPELAGLTLDPEGWVAIDDLIAGANAVGQDMTRDQLELVVRDNDKKRFTISEDGLRIRAAQGHSVSVSLGLTAQIPPDVLYHGTARKSLASIQGQGLLSGSRQQVHLSSDVPTAIAVGQRHGVPVVFEIDAIGAHASGRAFYKADNGVWLTDHVPVEFLRLMDSEEI